eukprot:g8624.t1
MPAYAAQRRGSRRGGSRAAASPEDDAEMAVPPAELTIQRQLGLVKGVPLSHSSNGTGSPTQFDPARAALCLLKEEDHVWTIETCMETINLLRARNNGLKAQLLEVDTDFADHVQARQRKIVELTEAAESAAAIKNELEEKLEVERADRRRLERDHQRQREVETLAYEQTIKGLTEEMESLRVFSGERDRANAQMEALEAANAELQDQQEIRMQSLRKKLADSEAGKEEEVRRLVLEAKEKMRDEVELAVGGAYQRLVEDNQELRDKLKQLDSKLKIVLSELEHEVAAKAGLKTELEILKALDSKSAGKIKYYMRMLKRSADELAHQCEIGDGGGATKDLRLCRSCGGSQRHVGGDRLGKRSSSANSVAGRRPGTAPAVVRRCPRGGSGRAGGDGNLAEAGKQSAFANIKGAADYRCAHESSGSGSSFSSFSHPRPCSSSPPTGPIGRVSPRGTGRRAQTAARVRCDVASIHKNANKHGSGCFGSGGITERPARARRAQTAGRCRVQSTGTSRCHPSVETPPRHPRRSPRGSDSGSEEGGVVFPAAAAAAAAAAATAGSMEERQSRKDEAEELATGAEISASEDVTRSYRQQQTERGEEEEDAMLTKRSYPSTSIDEGKRRPGDAHNGDSAAALTATVKTGLTGGVYLEHGKEGAGRDGSPTTADGRAVQCWRDSDACLEHHGGGNGSGNGSGNVGDATGTGGTGGRPDRPATCDGTRQRSPRRPSGGHRPNFPRQYHQNTGRKRKTPSNHVDGCHPGAVDLSIGENSALRYRSGPNSPRTRGQRPWTAAPNFGVGGGGGGGGDGGGGDGGDRGGGCCGTEQSWWERLAGGGQRTRHGRAACGGGTGAGALGGKLWGDADEGKKTREHELFDALRVAEHGGGRATSNNEENGVVPGQEGNGIDYAAAGLRGEEERLLMAVDNGDLDLLSPSHRQQGADGRFYTEPSPRAARTRAALASAGVELKNLLQATKPIQTVLIRERLGGVGNGSPTAPRPSEIDAVAAEEAAKKAAENISSVANTATAMKEELRGSEVAVERILAGAAQEDDDEEQAVAVAQERVECDPPAVGNEVCGDFTEQDMMMFASSGLELANGGDETSGSTSCGTGKATDSF